MSAPRQKFCRAADIYWVCYVSDYAGSEAISLKNRDAATPTDNHAPVLIPAEELVHAGAGGADHRRELLLGQWYVDERLVTLDPTVLVRQLQQSLREPPIEVEEGEIRNHIGEVADFSRHGSEKPLRRLRMLPHERNEGRLT